MKVRKPMSMNQKLARSRARNKDLKDTIKVLASRVVSKNSAIANLKGIIEEREALLRIADKEIPHLKHTVEVITGKLRDEESGNAKAATLLDLFVRMFFPDHQPRGSDKKPNPTHQPMRVLLNEIIEQLDGEFVV